MLRKLAWLVILLLGVQFLAAEIIEEIQIEGNKKISRETVQFYIKSRPGSIFDEGKLKDDFKILWETGFFENIRIESDNGSKGKIVRFILSENPLISAVTYKTNKKVKESDITQKLLDSNITIQAFSYYSPAKIRRAKKIITDMLLEKGFNQASVTIDEKIDNGQIALNILVDSGPKTRIFNVVFPGLNAKLLAPGFLRRGMKNNQSHSLLSTVLGKDVFNREKINDDLEEVRLRFQQKGYLEAKVGNPELSWLNQKTVLGKVQKMLIVSIPVEMGPCYRTGNISIDGNKVIRGDFLKQMIALKKGEIYDIKKRNKSVEAIQKFYGSLGYFYAQVAPRENLDPIKQIADLTVNIQENEVVYLGKLEFTGNTFTKDHVIRREWFLREGLRLNINALEDSIKRMKQLGLVTVEKMPEIKPDPQDPQKINITADVKEVNRQMINFNVGYSGYEGWFLALGYSTQNFLGMGETFSLNLQQGTIAKTYQFAFTEPYLFNTQASFGIDVSKTYYRYPNLYTRQGEGFNISTATRFWKFWGASLVYSWENVAISDVNENYSQNSYYSYYYTDGKRVISAFSPTIYYSTVDSPIFPQSGSKFLATYRYTGGLLGGDIYSHKLKLEFVKFLPLWSNHVLGLHTVYEAIEPFGGKAIPFYEKFFLGGERSIRGFEIYTLGPRDSNGSVLGGNQSLYFNLEYAIPLTQQFSFVFFYDVGNTYNSGTPVKLSDVYQSTGLELKIFVPMLNVPFRLIFAYNHRLLQPEDNHFVFRFAVGPSFY
ncbi:MAG: outer membrane protein assembly factor BamA [Chrysiogenales bacterium]